MTGALDTSAAGLLIGMDEAGYGPNLGPLVITVTAWEFDGHPGECRFYDALSPMVTACAERQSRRLHVADSKQVYSTARGIASLERSVLCALAMCGHRPQSLHELWSALDTQNLSQPFDEPWYSEIDVKLPTENSPDEIEESAAGWRECCEDAGIRLVAICSDIMLTERFNRLTAEAGSKGVCLSRTSLRLLRTVWAPDRTAPALLVADKHGGRNRYDELLDEILDEQMVFRVEEGRERSEYRIGSSRIVFRTRAESHLPVALASMVSKYVREMCMIAFNRFWCDRCPWLKPTKGYPVDARRFRDEIAEVQSQLGVPDVQLWRMK